MATRGKRFSRLPSSRGETQKLSSLVKQPSLRQSYQTCWLLLSLLFEAAFSMRLSLIIIVLQSIQPQLQPLAAKIIQLQPLTTSTVHLAETRSDEKGPLQARNVSHNKFQRESPVRCSAAGCGGDGNLSAKIYQLNLSAGWGHQSTVSGAFLKSLVVGEAIFSHRQLASGMNKILHRSHSLISLFLAEGVKAAHN